MQMRPSLVKSLLSLPALLSLEEEIQAKLPRQDAEMPLRRFGRTLKKLLDWITGSDREAPLSVTEYCSTLVQQIPLVAVFFEDSPELHTRCSTTRTDRQTSTN